MWILWEPKQLLFSTQTLRTGVNALSVQFNALIKTPLVGTFSIAGINSKISFSKLVASASC